MVRMYPEESLPLDQTEALMNRFFNTVNRFAQQSDMIPIVDDANLQSIMLVCQNGVDSAVVTALTILAPDRCGQQALRKRRAAGRYICSRPDGGLLWNLWRRGTLHSGCSGTSI